MPSQERLRLLENLGCVPPDPDWSDYALAMKTSWWGKRLDPKSFWSNRVVWLDGQAIGDAWRHGRSYPPMPCDDPSVADLSDNDKMGDGFDIQGGPNFHTVSTDREHVFWGNFVKAHPHPPDNIIRWQRDQAKSWLRAKNILENDTTYAARLRMKPEELDRILGADRREAEGLGYPSECLTPDAYRWSHIMQKRQEYAEMLASDGYKVCERIASGQYDVNIIVSNFFRHVYVDRKYIIEPLTDEDTKAANAWKVAYLRRLRQEKTDESYIKAYLKAWNLSEKQVFDESTQP
jgi:hypothetical protein